jgi:hypothetical protein
MPGFDLCVCVCVCVCLCVCLCVKDSETENSERGATGDAVWLVSILGNR